jgi:hypothetical protein
MLWSNLFPDQYPPKPFYDLNGDGVFNDRDVLLAYEVYLGKVNIASCATATKTDVSVVIDASNGDKAIKITGTNMWGSQVEIYFGAAGSNIHSVNGNLCVAQNLDIGGAATISSLATESFGTPKKLSWKANGDGTYTLIGT